MSEAGKAGVHALVRAVILFGSTLYILYLSEKGTLNYYIAPRMELYVKLAGLAMYALAVQQALRAYRSWKQRSVERSCDCAASPSGRWWKHAGIYVFFLFPLALGMFTPDKALGSQLVERKGMNFAASSSLQSGEQKSPGQATSDEEAERLPQQEAQLGDESISPNAASGANRASNNASPDLTDSTGTEPGDALDATDNPEPQSSGEGAPDEARGDVPLSEEELEALFPEDNALFSGYAKYARTVYNDEIIEVPEHSYTEVLTTLDLYKEQFTGKTIRISGFVYKPAELDADQFAVSRYAMQCCSADAAPYGVLSHYPRAATLAEDSWIEITGTITTTLMNDTEVLAIEVQKVRSIEEPADPYVYPNFDFGL